MVNPHIGRTLGRFHQQVARRITVKKPRRQSDGICQYPLLEEEMMGTVLEELDTYTHRRQNKVDQYIVTRPIFDLCLEAARRTGSWLIP